MKLRLPRLTIGMRAGLTIGIGGLVLLAVVTVLFLGFGSARRNTQDLLLGNARIALQLIQNGIHAELRPVERQVGFVGTFLETENPGQPLNIDGPLAKMMTGALAATPVTRAMSFVDLEAQMLDVRREDGSGVVSRGDLLFALYAPELVNAQKEYLQAHQRGVLTGELDSLNGFVALFATLAARFAGSHYGQILLY